MGLESVEATHQGMIFEIFFFLSGIIYQRDCNKRSFLNYKIGGYAQCKVMQSHGDGGKRSWSEKRGETIGACGRWIIGEGDGRSTAIHNDSKGDRERRIHMRLDQSLVSMLLWF